MSVSFERDPISSEPISAVVTVPRGRGFPDKQVQRVRELLQSLERSFEILVIDYGPGSDFGPPDSVPSHVRILAADSSRDYGQALDLGFRESRFPLIFTIPGVSGYCPDELKQMLDLIDQVDIVCCYDRDVPVWRRAMRGWLIGLAFGLWVRQPRCPVRLYRRDVLERIPIQSRGYFAEVEILAKANFLTALLAEVGVRCDADRDAEVDAKDPFWRSDAWRLFQRPEFRTGLPETRDADQSQSNDKSASRGSPTPSGAS